MRILIQRVSRASVSIADNAGEEVVGEIGLGLVVFVGIRDGDKAETAKWMAEKVVNLRIFGDLNDKMNLSVSDVNGSILAVSQFTLYGDALKGNRPNFMGASSAMRAMKTEEAEMIYDIFLGYLVARLGPEKVASGRFRAKMRVELTNEGPVTILVDR
jgi:D-tyrosyl-tRNA(Tyr) deacylase